MLLKFFLYLNILFNDSRNVMVDLCKHDTCVVRYLLLGKHVSAYHVSGLRVCHDAVTNFLTEL